MAACIICSDWTEWCRLMLTPIKDYKTPQQIATDRRRPALPRLGKPRDIGLAVVFPASDDAQWIKGAALVVDGGYTAGV
jgi:NAD(P)-dependent dehydrogenase (short-subunit alcohol dehydrogenase family)